VIVTTIIAIYSIFQAKTKQKLNWNYRMRGSCTVTLMVACINTIDAKVLGAKMLKDLLTWHHGWVVSMTPLSWPTPNSPVVYRNCSSSSSSSKKKKKKKKKKCCCCCCCYVFYCNSVKCCFHLTLWKQQSIAHDSRCVCCRDFAGCFACWSLINDYRDRPSWKPAAAAAAAVNWRGKMTSRYIGSKMLAYNRVPRALIIMTTLEVYSAEHLGS